MRWEDVKYIYPHLTNESRQQNKLPMTSEGTAWSKSTKTLGHFVFQKLKKEKRHKNKVFKLLEEKEIPNPTNDHIKEGKKELSLSSFTEILFKLGTWSYVTHWPISHDPIGLRNQITLQQV